MAGQDDWVDIRIKIPPGWRRELKEAAGAMAVTVSDLVRLVLRDFLRSRYTEEERRALERLKP